MSRLFDYLGITVNKGDYLFREGDKADVLYMIHSGKVEIYRKSGNIQKRLQVLGEGEFVGEMAVIDSLPRSANAVALEDCQLIKMDKASFEKSIKENHQFAISVIQFMSKRMRDTNDKVIYLAKETMHNKIIIETFKELLNNGKKDQSGIWMLIKLDGLIERLESNFAMANKKLLAILYEMIAEKIFIIKKDKKRTIWLGYKKEHR